MISYLLKFRNFRTEMNQRERGEMEEGVNKWYYSILIEEKSPLVCLYVRS